MDGVSAALRRWLHEAPLVIGVLVGWWLLWRFGHSFVLDGAVEGYGWEDYLENAWMITHRENLGFANFRRPLHGAMLGALGERLGSYPNAGIVISSLSAGGLVLAAGLLARALGGPWAGGAAAAAVVSTRVTLTAGRWANSYTLLAAGSGLSLGLAACVARWPRLWLVALTGIISGIAWGVDSRGLAMLPGAGGLVLLGAWRTGQWWKRVVFPLVFAAGLGVGPWSVQAFWLEDVYRPGPVEQLRFQRQVSLRWARSSHDAALMDACAEEAPDVLPSLQAIQRPCAQQMWRYNTDTKLPEHVPWPVGLVAASLLGVLIPARRREAWLDGVVAFGGGMASLVAFALWFPYPDRYIIQFCVPLAALLPVAVHRIANHAPQRMRLGGLAAGAVAALLCAWLLDPTGRHQPTKVQVRPYDLMRTRVAQQVGSSMRDGDAFLDCANLHTATRWLPTVHAPGLPMAKMDADRCIAWLQGPTGGERHLVLVRPQEVLTATDQTEVSVASFHSQWQQLWEISGVALWVHREH